jgi:GNAT superfamily N-acetyltransferase
MIRLHKNCTMNPITVRKADLNDLESLLRFEQGVIDAERPFDSTLKTGDINYYDIQEMITSPNFEIVVAESENKIIGCGYGRIVDSKPYLKHQKNIYLGFMYVDPIHRGKGVNQKILEALKNWAITQGVTEMRLDVYHDNIVASKAYEKAGFKKHMVEMRLGLDDK